MSGFRSALLDVGGTIWPDDWGDSPTAWAARVTALGAALPELDPDVVARVVELAVAAGRRIADEPTPDVTAVLAAQLDGDGIVLTPSELEVARRTLALPAVDHTDLFPGTVELLEHIRRLGAPAIVVSNTIWRDAAAFWRDFAAFGIDQLVTAVITSVDVGVRKPATQIFRRALAVAGTDAGAAVMIGNSETADIEPARNLGMRTIRVDVEPPAQVSSSADAVVAELAAIPGVIDHWIA